MKTKILFFLFWISFGFGQVQQRSELNEISLSPEGIFDTVFDHYGNSYSLQDIMINQEVNHNNKWIDPGCDSGIFNLNFMNGSGFEDPTNSTHIARRAVICQVFKDLSDFINSPLHNVGNTQKIEIWVRDINGLINPSNPASSNVLGMASSFYVRPTPPTALAVKGGIIDNEIWKTVHTGTDSYSGITAPLANSSSSGNFYHGLVAINFSNISNNWNLNTGINCPSGQMDLYSVLLHEVTHALGFASLINEHGQSRLGANYPYFTRFDTFLQSNTGQYLLSNNGCNPMYNNNFIGNVNSLHPGCTSPNGLGTGSSDTTNCTSAIRYFSPMQTIPVYTPQCYETGSSLSHFEDMCYSNPYGFPNGNNNYFAMSNANGNGVTKRHLTTEERQTLCDIGYSLKSNYATGSYNAFTYPISGSCNGIPVAGVNDGIDTGGTFTFIGLGTTANPIIIPINGAGGILTNDYNGVTGNTNDIRIECLEDVYDNTSLINGSATSFSSSGFTASITFSSNNIGTHLLRYIPVVNGVRGNITYVYVNIPLTAANFNCTAPSICNIVNNGSFETGTASGPFTNNTLSCWGNLRGSPDLFTRNLPDSSANFTTAANTFGSIPATDTHNGTPNDQFAGIWTFNANQSEAFQTLLNTPLVAGQTYVLSFWAKANNSYGYGAGFESNIESSLFFFTSPTLNNTNVGLQNANNFNIVYPNSLQLAAVNIPPNINDQWIFYSIPFTFPSGSPDHNCLAITKGNYNPVNVETYTFIDDISIVPIDQLTAISIPANLCAGQTLNNLENYLSPAPPGGTFTGIGVSGSSFLATAPGTYTINYTYTNNNGCEVTIANTFEVLNCTNSNTPNFPNFGPYCIGATPVTLPTVSTNGINGVWNPSVIDTSVAGTFNYTFTPEFGQNAQVITIPITIYEPFSPTFNFESTTFCQGSTFMLPPATGVIGQWELASNPGVAVSQLNTNSIGSFDYVFVPSVDCSSSVTFTFTIADCSPPVLVGAEVSCEETKPKHDEVPGEDNIADGACIRVCENGIIEYYLTGNTTLITDTHWNITGGTVINSDALHCEIAWNNDTTAHIQAVITLATAPPYNSITLDRCVEKIKAPEALFTVNPFGKEDEVFSCLKTPLHFTNLSTAGDGNGELYYFWDFGDGNTSTEFEPSYTYNQTGSYTVTLTVTNGCSCIDIYEKKITIDKGIDLVECPSVVCEGQIASYKASSDCKILFSTQDGTITSNDGQNVTVVWDNIDESGFATLIMQPDDDSCGKCTATAKIPVIQTKGIIKGPETICLGEQAIFNLPQWPTTDFNWHIEDIEGDGDLVWNNQRNEIIIQAIKPGMITLSCEYFNTLLGCGGIAQMSIKILPKVNVSPVDFVCIDTQLPLEFTDNDGNPISVTYEVNAPNASGVTNPVYSGTGTGFTFESVQNSSGLHVAGFYTVEITSAEVCGTTPMEIRVIDGLNPKPVINGSQTVCPGTPYTYTATNSPIVTDANIIWTVTGGNFVGSSTGSNVQVIFDPAATPPYTVSAHYEQNGCISAATIYTVQPINIDFGFELPIADEVCGSSTQNYSIVTLPTSNVSINDLDYIAWSIVPSNAGSVVGDLNAQNVTVNWNNNATSAQLIVTVRSCGIENFIAENITINNTVPVTITASDNVVCAETPVTFTLFGLSSYSSIEWNFGDGNTESVIGISPYTFTTTNAFDNVADTTSYTVTATIHNPNGCTNPAIVTIPITVIPSPVVQLDKTTHFNLCLNNQPADYIYTIPTQAGWAGTVAIQWFHNGTAIPGATSQSYTIPTPDEVTIFATNVVGSYYAMVTNEVIVGSETFNCTGFSKVLEVVNNCPTGGGCTTSNSITFSNTLGCGTATYTATPLGSPDQVNFLFPSNPGLAVYDTTAPYSATFSDLDPGEYIVKIDAQVSDPTVCWNQEVSTFIIPYRADLKYEITCNNGAYDITLLDHSRYFDNGSGNPIGYYEFSILNGTTTIATQAISSPVSLPAINQATFSSVAPGTYNFSILISGNGNTPCTYIIEDVILPAITPVTGFTMTDRNGTPVTAICEGEPVQLTPMNSTSPANCPDCIFEWQFIPDGAINMSATPIKTFEYTGNNQNILLTVTNPNGCIAQYSTSIEVYEIDIVGEITPSITTACMGDTITLSYNTTSGSQIPINLDWFYNSVNNPIGSGLTMDVTEPGYYFAYAYTADGCREVVDIKHINVSFTPIEAPVISGNTNICSGNVITLSVPEVTSTTYEWTITNSANADVVTLTGSTINYLPPFTASYTFNVVAQSGNCQSDATTYTVVVRDTPNIPNIKFDVVNCNPYTVNAWVDNPQADVVYNWSNGGIGTSTTLNHDGPLQVRAELLGCSITNQIDLPVDLNSHEWLFPDGCFTFCKSEFKQGYILGPLDQLTWKWFFNGSGYSAGSDWVPTSGDVQTGYYDLLLKNDDCEVAFGTANITIKDCKQCDVSIKDIKSMTCETINNQYVYAVEFVIENNTGAVVPATLTVPNGAGYFSPSTITLNPGTNIYTGYFIPDTSFNDGDSVPIAININDGKEINCLVIDKVIFTCEFGGRMAELNNKVAMAPNPATQTTTIWYELMNKGKVELLITDATGRILYQLEHQENQGQFTIDVNHLPKGYYPVKLIQNGSTVYADKLLKQ